MKCIQLVFVVLLCSFAVQAQNNSIAPFLQDSNYTFNTFQKVEQEGFFSTYQSDLGLTANDLFTLHNCEYSADKKFSCRYNQQYKGFLVEGSSFLLHGERGLVLYAAGNQIKNLDVPVSNPISMDSALSVVLSAYDSVTFDYQVDSIVAGWREAYEDSTYTGIPVGALLISAPQNNNWQGSGYKLMWKFMLSTVAPQRENISVYVDALTGAFVNGFDRSHYAGYGTGNVSTIYNGWQNFTTYKCSTCSKWRLETDEGIRTFKGEKKKLKDADNNWSDYEEQNMTTVHWATERAWHYFSNRHGRNGSDNKGMRLDNHGNLDMRYARYSIGDGGEDKIEVGGRINGISPATLDILSHEYTHAFISRNPQLNPWDSPIEAGALNEGFADIFGILSERYTVGSTSWLAGEEVDASYGDKNMRDFENPHNTIPNNQPAKYHETDYWDFTNSKHINAGVLTHWFYLLSEGGTYNGVTVPALGMDKADDIAFITMMWWLWPNVMYYQAQEQSINATIHHYGKCSKEHKAVVRAWQAVGFGSGTLATCRDLRLDGARVVNHTELVNNTQIVQFRIINTESPGPVNPEYISWQLPADWGYTMSQDKNEITLHSVANQDSKEILAIIDKGDGAPDTLKHIVHFVDYTDTNDYSAYARKAAPQHNTINEAATIFQVYPNPTSGLTKVYIGEGVQNAQLDIYNFLGVRVKSQKLDKVMSTLDCSKLSVGTYIFRLTTPGSQQSLKITINR
jgi:Zn-dependent metalloprotease